MSHDTADDDLMILFADDMTPNEARYIDAVFEIGRNGELIITQGGDISAVYAHGAWRGAYFVPPEVADA